MCRVRASVDNYIATGAEKFDSNQVDARVDYNFSDRLHLFRALHDCEFQSFRAGSVWLRSWRARTKRHHLCRKIRGQTRAWRLVRPTLSAPA